MVVSTKMPCIFLLSKKYAPDVYFSQPQLFTVYRLQIDQLATISTYGTAIYTVSLDLFRIRYNAYDIARIIIITGIKTSLASQTLLYGRKGVWLYSETIQDHCLPKALIGLTCRAMHIKWDLESGNWR